MELQAVPDLKDGLIQDPTKEDPYDVVIDISYPSASDEQILNLIQGSERCEQMLRLRNCMKVAIYRDGAENPTSYWENLQKERQPNWGDGKRWLFNDFFICLNVAVYRFRFRLFIDIHQTCRYSQTMDTKKCINLR